MKTLTPSQIRSFRKKVLAYYDKHGRSLPWRKTRDPYRVLATEIAVDLEAALEQFTKIAARPGKGKS